MKFIFRYLQRFRVFEYRCRQFDWREDSNYVCITCGLPYTADPVDKRLND